MYSAIVLAGGVGSRMNQDLPKQFLPLAGKPMILHTLERLEQIPEIDEIIIVCHCDYIDLVKKYIQEFSLKKKYLVVNGGSTRQESSYIGVKNAKNNRIIIHEAARPFVTIQEFKDLITLEDDVATYGIDIPFTVSKRNGELIDSLLERSKLVNIQLPQKFVKSNLMYAYEQAFKDEKIFTEDTSLLIFYTHQKVKIMEGRTNNIKITTALDLIIAEEIYRTYFAEEQSDKPKMKVFHT